MTRDQLFDFCNQNTHNNSDAIWLAQKLMHIAASKSLRETLLVHHKDDNGCNGMMCFVHGPIASIALLGTYSGLAKILNEEELIADSIKVLKNTTIEEQFVKEVNTKVHLTKKPELLILSTSMETSNALYQAIEQELRHKPATERSYGANRPEQRQAPKSPIAYDIHDALTGKTYRAKGSSLREAVKNLLDQLTREQSDSAQESPRTSTDGKGAEESDSEKAPGL